MAARLSFGEFDAKLKSGTLSPAEHREYLELDPTADVVRVRFKRGALRDTAPPRYDVDRELYLAQRAQQEREFVVRSLAGLTKVVAEGDSWFNLPDLWIPRFPKAIADRLQSNKQLAVKNIAKWGHTLAEMLAKKEYRDQIRRFEPQWFIFSGGGNDLQESLKRGALLKPYAEGMSIDECLSSAGIDLLEEIAEGYRTLLNDVAIEAPDLPSVCYAYDFPRPTYKKGKYIGQYIDKMGYPKKTWDAVAKVIIDRLSEAIRAVVDAFPKAQFLDCRGETASYPFFDDMHPGNDGFTALTGRFEKTLGVAPTIPLRPSGRPRKVTRKAAGTPPPRQRASRGSSRRRARR